MTKSTLIILYLTLFSISIWLVFDVYSNYQKMSIPQDIQNISKPISAEVDTEMIELLNRRSNNE